jgi:beta-xylosidase
MRKTMSNSSRLRRSCTAGLAALILASSFCLAGNASAQAWRSDRGDGTYANPPLNADYPDPDIIRVGEDFYFATTTFANVPGLSILHSKDLVNWEIVSHVIPRLEGREQYDLKNGTSYRAGVFAPSLRYYQGTFYVAVTPVGQNTRIYYSKDPKGPWDVKVLDRPAFDPALFFDTDGKAYIATSGGWDGTEFLLSLSSDLTHVVEEKKIHFNKGAEGSKLVKRGDWYYLFNAIPGRLALTVSRAKNLAGPWETREQIDDRTGGHQGAIVDLPDGSDFGFVMLDAGAIGRVTNISPVFWQDGWPVWGTKDAPGRVPAIARKPIQGKPFVEPPASDDFSGSVLGLQWQWNHNPDNTKWSLTERPGFLRLKPTEGTQFFTARNTLTQKGQGPWSRGEVKLDISQVQAGDVCGFGTLGKFNGSIAVNGDAGGKPYLSMQLTEDTMAGPKTEVRVKSVPITAKSIFLRTDMDFKAEKGQVSYSLDGKRWTILGGDFRITYDWQTGTFQGPQYAIYCFNPKPGKGFVDVDAFTLSGKP